MSQALSSEEFKALVEAEAERLDRQVPGTRFTRDIVTPLLGCIAVKSLCFTCVPRVRVLCVAGTGTGSWI